MLNQRDVVVFDVDGTVIFAQDMYDKVFRETSAKFFGSHRSFCLSRDPQTNAEDKEYVKRTGSQNFKLRAKQVGVPVNVITDDLQRRFFDCFDRTVKAYPGPYQVEYFNYVEEFLQGLHGVTLALLSTSTRAFQSKALGHLLKYFDLKMSYFLGECPCKQAGLECIASSLQSRGLCRSLTYVGDAPADMYALKQVRTPLVKKVAVGVAMTRFVSEEELFNAGADLVIDCYSARNLSTFIKHIEG